MEIIRASSPLLFVYAVGFILTFGIFYRNQAASVGARQIIYSFLWPIWWPVANGLGPTLDIIHSAVSGTDGRKGMSLAVGLFAVGHCLSSNWYDCTKGVVVCSGVIVKSSAMFFPPLNFFYVVWLMLGS